MAKNQTRSMDAEFAQGSVDETYIQLTPDRGGVVEWPPVDRLGWPTYRRCGQDRSSPFLEAEINRAHLPREIKTSGDGDTRTL